MNNRIQKSRLLLQNPYAYVAGDDGEYEAVFPPVISIQKARGTEYPKAQYTQDEIEKIARNLQTEMWVNRETIWGTKDVAPLAVTDCSTAFSAIGFDYESLSSLGSNATSDVAGYINADKKYAATAQHFPLTEQKFTAAHELGHALLHQANGMHRERPASSSHKVRRPRQELEADRFASAFLMPRILLKREFNHRFQTEKFIVIDENVIGLLGNNNRASLKTRRQLSLALATADRFHTSKFLSLTELFGLSKTAVAIRLEQVDIV